MTVGEKIRRRRTELGLTQREVAGENVTRNMICRIERGDCFPSLDTLRSVAKALSVSVAYLVSEEDDYAAFTVMEAPGHTPGGIVLLGGGTAEHMCFVGDTLFQGSCGRTDLAGGDSEQLKATLARIKREVPPETNLMCGHGEITTMEDELRNNPYLV